MPDASYQERRGKIETYFDRTAADAWSKLTSDAKVSRVRETVRAGRDDMRRTLLSWLPEDLTGKRLLDAGCGTGMLAVEAARRGAEVVAIDVAPTLIEIARERLPSDLGPGSVDFQAGDMLAHRRHVGVSGLGGLEDVGPGFQHRRRGGGGEHRDLEVDGDRSGGHRLGGGDRADDQIGVVALRHAGDQRDGFLLVRSVVLVDDLDRVAAPAAGRGDLLRGQLDAVDQGLAHEGIGRGGRHDHADLDVIGQRRSRQRDKGAGGEVSEVSHGSSSLDLVHSCPR